MSRKTFYMFKPWVIQRSKASLKIRRQLLYSKFPSGSVVEIIISFLIVVCQQKPQRVICNCGMLAINRDNYVGNPAAFELITTVKVGSTDYN